MLGCLTDPAGPAGLRLAPDIGLTLDWTETPKACEAIESRTLRGKAVLALGN
ncbi:hypothetical protein ACWDUL_34535 [Nocardia niigatensis]|uniref:hypothetical protein n=1 Tax=Nocardia niigatensis TaxID=209249 RepID=UPI0002EA509E|nr:hypothetical protein [Nocardia niigatensis]